MNNIVFVLNGKETFYSGEKERRLLDVIRDDYKLKGPKEGCGEGECGACAVLLDGNAVHSCLIPMSHVHNKTVTTIEGFKETKRYQAIEKAFIEHGAVQCGFCTPGMIIATESMLNKNPNPTEEEIREGLSGNLCRCTGYNMIVQAVMSLIGGEEKLW